MNRLSFHLPVFEGPLDLLLHLIAKHQLNIADIEISKLLEQYLLYLEECQAQDFELAGEFLEMAARLIYIKTVSLLPKPEEAETAKRELEGTLIEYALCKRAAETLRKLYGERYFVREPMPAVVDPIYRRTHAPSVLLQAYLDIGVRHLPEDRERHAAAVQEAVHYRTVPVYVCAVRILRKLWKTGRSELARMYEPGDGRSMRVATFLAVLELTRNGRIRLSEDNTELFFERPQKKRAEGAY